MHIDSDLLPLKALKLMFLDKDHVPVKKTATGFITIENGQAYLCTAWHAITGVDPFDIKVKNPSPIDKVHIYSQNADQKTAGIVAIGGKDSQIIELYDHTSTPKTPRWLQDKLDKPHGDLNSIHIKIPTTHDVIKIPIDSTSLTLTYIGISEDSFITSTTAPQLTEKIYIVGYPYNYSSSGEEKPTPIVLTRHIASMHVKDRPLTFLIDGFGFPTMSGSPVFVKRNNKFILFGMYTGRIFPDGKNYSDHENAKNDKAAALGTISNLILVLRENWNKQV